MNQQMLLGVDIGTQGVKTSLFTVGGDCLHSAFFPSQLHQPEPGITEEDPEFQLASVCKGIKECIQNAGTDNPEILCLAIDGQMAGIIGIDHNGLAVTPYDSWLDTRCTPYIKLLKKEAETEILSKTGNTPSFNHGPKILWWQHERPEVYDKIASFVQPGGYAAMRLCGLTAKDAFIDRTYLHFSGFADNQSAVWDKGLTEHFKVDMSKLPQITESTRIIGEMTPEMARNCGLTHPIKVAAGCGDTAASFLSCGAVEEGICVDVAGTASVFAATVKEFACDSKEQVMGCSASATAGLWHPYAYINGGGMNLEWYIEKILGREKNDPQRFSDLQPEKLNPSDTDPLFIPHMAGRVTPAMPELRGTFAGLTWNHTRQDMFMAILESVALEYGVYYNALQGMYPNLQLRDTRITGGGESSRIWKEIKSAILQTPLTAITPAYGAPMGSAIIAGCACGVFPNTKTATDSWITLKDSVQADPRLYPHYQRRVTMYKKLIDNLDSFYSI